MPAASRNQTSQDPGWRSLWRDVSLSDGRRPEEQSPDQLSTLPAGHPWLDLLFLGGAVVALAVGLRLLTSGPAPFDLGRIAEARHLPAERAQQLEATARR